MSRPADDRPWYMKAPVAFAAWFAAFFFGLFLAGIVAMGPGFDEGVSIAAMPKHELGAVFRCAAKIGDAAATQAQQMSGGLVGATEVVATERMARLVLDDGTPDDETCICFCQCGKLFAVRHVVPVAEQNDSVSSVARFVADVPVVTELVQRDQYIVVVLRRRARDVADHREKERVYLCVVAVRFVEQQQRDRVALVSAQTRGIPIDKVIQFARHLLNSLACLLLHERAVAQRARHGGLRDAGEVRDIARGRVSNLHTWILVDNSPFKRCF